MANEWVLLTALEPAVSFICADGAGIEKGTLLKLTDPQTVAAQSAAHDACIGIAAGEKIASDGKTYIPVIMRAIVKAYAKGAITVGTAVAASGTANGVVAAAAADVGCKTIGIALETAADTETFKLLLSPGCNNTAYA